MPRLSLLAVLLYLTVTNLVPLRGAPPVMCTNAASLDWASFIALLYALTRPYNHTTPPPIANAACIASMSTNLCLNFFSLTIRCPNYCLGLATLVALWLRGSSIKLYPTCCLAALSTNFRQSIVGNAVVFSTTAPSLSTCNNINLLNTCYCAPAIIPYTIDRTYSMLN
jgi:hypothetical protein